MSAGVRRRLSCNVPGERPTHLSSRRFSEDSYSSDRGVFHISGFKPFGKLTTPGALNQRLQRNKLDVKSILKKSNSFDNIAYKNLIRAISSDLTSSGVFETTSVASIASNSDSSSKVSRSSHGRRVRFSDSVYCQDEDSGSYIDSISEDFGSDIDESDTIFKPNNQESQNSFSQNEVFVDFPIDEIREEESVGKRESTVKAAQKRPRLLSQSGSSVSNNSHVGLKCAWTKKSNQNDLNVPHQKAAKPRQQPQIKIFERSKTDLGTTNYKDVQSKLRRMGFFNSKSSRYGPKLSSQPRNSLSSSDEENCAMSQRNKMAPQLINGTRSNGDQTIVHEEIYNISVTDDKSVKYLSESCAKEDFRSLGDQYARFLKGRYNLDDISCS